MLKFEQHRVDSTILSLTCIRFKDCLEGFTEVKGCVVTDIKKIPPLGGISMLSKFHGFRFHY